MQRYFISTEQFTDKTVIVTGEDAHHIRTVMRAKTGDTLIVADNVNKEAIASIQSIDRFAIKLCIVKWLHTTTEPKVQVTLAQGLLKGDKLEWVMQKCTEIGAAAFIPFTSERTIVQYDKKKEDRRCERWRKILKEAAEQSQRSRIPLLEPCVSWSQLLRYCEQYDAVWYCDEKEYIVSFGAVLQPFFHRWNSDDRAKVLVIIGPEGGFTEKETAQAEQAGAICISLGPRILRAETAGIVALTAILYEAGEMGNR